MASPTWDQYMLPLLKALEQTSPLPLSDLYAELASTMGLTDEDVREVIPSGQLRYKNRISWAAIYLGKVGAIDRTKRATYAIAERGRELLAEGVPVTIARLAQFPEYHTFRGRARSGGDDDPASQDVPPSPSVSPLEAIEQASAQIRAALEADLLDRLRRIDPYAFERLVVRVLGAMGYGRDGTLETTKASGDGGIDGVISQDPLGLDRIYIQAKRFTDASVQSKDIQAFMGALSTSHGDRGVFITTSSFTKAAIDTVGKSTFRVELIDGPRLAKLMVGAGVGVQPVHIDPVYRLDEDFFDEL